MPAVQPVAVCIVLDRSGSMASRAVSARRAVNDYVAGLAADDTTRSARISLLIFDSDSIDVIRDRTDVPTWRPVNADEYSPRGGTPLFDAVAHGVANLDKELDPARRLLVIVTDGYENASREHTVLSIKALLDDRQRRGWTVLYLGADHDAWQQASAIGLQQSSVAEFRGLDQAADVLQQATTSIAQCVTFAFSAEQRTRLQEPTTPSQDGGANDTA